MQLVRVVIPVLRDPAEVPSGSTRLAWDEALHLARLGHEVWVVGPSLSAAEPIREARDGVNVLTYPVPRFGLLDPRRVSAHQHRTAALLRRHLPGPPDVIHGHAPLQYEGALAVAGAQTRTAYTVHSPARLEMLVAPAESAFAAVRRRIAAEAMGRVERRVLDATSLILGNSAYTQRLLTSEHGLAPERTRVIPGWVDLSRFRPSNDRAALKRTLGWPDGRVLFTLRRLVPRMGLDRLIGAFASVAARHPDVTLSVGGYGSLRGPLEDLARARGIAPRVRFEGQVPDEILPAMYAAADAFVLPTTALECFGLISLEALACGRPVLATPVGAIPEVVGAVEKAWLAADAGEPGLTCLLDQWARGALPEHTPEELRSFVEHRYGAEERLRELTSALFGQEKADGGAEEEGT